MIVEELSIGSLKPNPSNPNEMDERTFNALCESLQEEGWVQPLQVVPDGDGTYEIVGGHHRWEAAKVLGMTHVPCVLLDPSQFDRDRRDWNLVKQNVLHGKLNPEKFTQLYDRLVKTYDKEVMQSLMGFTSQDAFQKVYREVKSALPAALQDALDKVKDEIRTIDDLSLVLNRLFAEHGETLPSNFMVFSWGGREVLWVRCDDEAWQAAQRLVRLSEESGRPADVLFVEAMSTVGEEVRV